MIPIGDSNLLCRTPVWWFVQQFLYGVLTLTPSAARSGGVAFWAHIGGFLIGMILIVPFIERARRRARWAGWP